MGVPPPPRTPGQRAGLTHGQVLAAARDVVAEGGLEALTMRALAQRLGVRPNALYSHVESKTILVDQLLDRALAAVEVPDADVPDPLRGVHALMTSTYRVLLAHADLVPIYLARHGARGPTARHLGDAMLALLARAGVTGARAREALQVLIVYTIGSAAFASRSPFATEDVPPPSGDNHAAHFDHGLCWILAGIGVPPESPERMSDLPRSARGGPTSPRLPAQDHPSRSSRSAGVIAGGARSASSRSASPVMVTALTASDRATR